ncbi:hypothetical protein [Sphingosinicella sp.]|uniref:hypothetical protein n=1 Tax=Sphingosinicella sp. TaxID=1917971 RepID=UPI004037EA8B
MDMRRVAIATLVAGVLDIASAFVFAGMNGGTPARVLAGIASGPFGPGVTQEPWAPALGLAIHFAIMTAMVAFYAALAARQSELLARLGPVLAGVGYGLLLYAFMYWVVLPLRWPDVHPVVDADRVAKAVFAHVVLVGLPIAFLIGPRRGALAAARA